MSKSSKGGETSSAATANAAAVVGGSNLGSNLGGRQRRRRDSPVRKQKAPAKSVMSLERLEDCEASPYLGAMSNVANSELMDKLRKVDAMGYGEFVRGDPGSRKLCLDPEVGYRDAETSVKGTFLDAAAAASAANDVAAAAAAACSGGNSSGG
jgi:hypothetical protein